MDPIDVLQFDGCTQGHVHIVRDCTDEMRGIFEPWGLDVTDVPDADIAIWEHAPALLAEVRQLREDHAMSDTWTDIDPANDFTPLRWAYLPQPPTGGK